MTNDNHEIKQKELRETKALSLRNQAHELLQEARELDDLNPYIVMHSTEYGTSGYVLWSKDTPDEEQSASILDCEFEPEKEEHLDVDALTLDEITGTSVSSRLPVEDEHPNNAMDSSI